MTDDGEAAGENAQIGNSRRNPRPRYRRRLVRRPRATSSQQTNTVENLPSSGIRKSSDPASLPVTSLQAQVTDIPLESCDKTDKVLWILYLPRLKLEKLTHFCILQRREVTDLLCDLLTKIYFDLVLISYLQSLLLHKTLILTNVHFVIMLNRFHLYIICKSLLFPLTDCIREHSLSFLENAFDKVQV